MLAPLIQNLGGGAGGVRRADMRIDVRHSPRRMPFLLRSIVIGALMTLSACKTESVVRSAEVDDFGDTIAVASVPQRIVSLNPATTDLMFALGAGSRLVGRTHWDLYPSEAKAVPDLGSGIRPNVEAVLGARPDLVLLYASKDNRPAASAFRKAGVNTLSLKIDHIADFYRASQLIGRVIGDSARGVIISDSVRKTLQLVRDRTQALEKPTVFWHVWDAPLITIGNGSYMNELVEIAGATNVYGTVNEVSPQVSIEDVLQKNPMFIIAGPEGKQKLSADPRWAQARAVLENHVLAVDTTIVGRPSVRLGEAAVHLAKLLHEGIIF